VLTGAELETSLPQLVVSDDRAALGPVAHALHDDPTAQLAVVGITGTNGKTTAAWILDQGLRALGQAPALLGTVASRAAGAKLEPSSFTTPEADDLARFAAACVAAGSTHLVMEVSSHGLSQARTAGVHFRVAAFTNLTQDHLDFHETMAAYGEAKAALFLRHAPGVCVIHVGDAFGVELARRARAAGRTVCTVGCVETADLWAGDVVSSASGLTATIHNGPDVHPLRSPLVGAHNLENLLVALGCMTALGHDVAESLTALEHALGAPGRLERVPDPRGVLVLVDYAHTPDALRRAIASVRALTAGQLSVVFGCGGDRDADKRPLMGAAAASADHVFVTSDNPRTEDPDAIISQILPGLLAEGRVAHDLGATDGFRVEADRATAISMALRHASPGDTVLIAGKGHEDYQIVGTEKRDFDDRVCAAAVIAEIMEGAH
jgi:UDP-N-acetylmuramoyl-L-alanyl-D-glutamate--2,6-diaminopimelate ligase